MKYFIVACGVVAALGVVQMSIPVHAQGDVKALCNNKHGLGKRWSTASEGERKSAAARIAACIRSGGKS